MSLKGPAREGKKSQGMIAGKNNLWDLVNPFFTTRMISVGEVMVIFTLCLTVACKWPEVLRKETFLLSL